MFASGTRRTFLATAAGAAGSAALPIIGATSASLAGARSGRARLVVNDDGHVFPNLSDDLRPADLRRYLESYCVSGVDAVAYCVGDMSWPTWYPTIVGNRAANTSASSDTLRQLRVARNLANFESEQGGYFGAAFRTIQDLGKKAIASFRMNDAHYSGNDSPYASTFWKKHSKLVLGKQYGYYGGGLNYEHAVVRDHFFDRVMEFVATYPDIDGVELDAMRSPFFFPPDKGAKAAPLFTDLVRKIRAELSKHAWRLERPKYTLSVNVPVTPELALESGLDVVSWDAEKLFDWMSVGPYQGYMNHPMKHWKHTLRNGTPAFAYVNVSPQTGQYLGRDEFRAAAANAYGGGAEGIYLFNYPCCFELVQQQPVAADTVPSRFADLTELRQRNFRQAAQVLTELGEPKTLRRKPKHFLFYFGEGGGYRHYAPEQASMNRAADDAKLKAQFRCFEDFDQAKVLTLIFKLENVMRDEEFTATLNDRPIDAGQQDTRYAANGRDSRVHTVKLGPYQQVHVTLRAEQMRQGENTLVVTPRRLIPKLRTAVNLREIELVVRY